ncbi:MAG: ATP-binding protein [Pseudomonadota bacterium]
MLRRDHSLTLSSDLSEFEKLVDLVDRFADAYDLDPVTRHHVHLAVEELSTNAIRHGYRNNPNGWIRAALRPAGDGRVLLSFSDGAPSFNPFEDVPQPDVDATLEDREIGGLGLFLIRELADEWRYDRLPGQNRVIVGFGPDKTRSPRKRGLFARLFLRSPASS